MKKLILIVIALVIGYVLVANLGQQQTAKQQEQRETQIMEKQKQFMDQTRNLGPQMQKDLDNRMQTSEKKDQ